MENAIDGDQDIDATNVRKQSFLAEGGVNKTNGCPFWVDWYFGRKAPGAVEWISID